MQGYTPFTNWQLTSYKVWSGLYYKRESSHTEESLDNSSAENSPLKHVKERKFEYCENLSLTTHMLLFETSLIYLTLSGEDANLHKCEWYFIWRHFTIRQQ